MSISVQGQSGVSIFYKAQVSHRVSKVILKSLRRNKRHWYPLSMVVLVWYDIKFAFERNSLNAI